MDLQHIVKKLQQELTCSICVKSFLNPTTLACGHNFCHACIVSYWGQFPLEIACPQCQEKIPWLNFIPNRQLANITKLVEELSVDIKQITEEGHVCKDHPPALKAFCRDELVLFCSMCDISQEHLAHDVVPVAEAAEEYKAEDIADESVMSESQTEAQMVPVVCNNEETQGGKTSCSQEGSTHICTTQMILRTQGHLLSVMGTLESEKEKISKYHSEEGTQAVALIEQIEQERQLVITEFNSIRQFLEEQENFLLLKVMETLEKGMFWKKTKHAAIFFREVSTFDDLIQGLKEKCQQSAVELLQDVESTLKRCKNTLMNPVTLPPWMKLGVWDLFDFNAFLGTTMKQFKDTLASGYQIQKANVTLDPDTAHPKLILSEDLKSVWMGRSSQNLIKDDKRFDHMMCVLGREMFLGGRHYWDVVVENEGDWGVGVARISMKRKGVENFINMKGFWALTKWGHLCVYMNPPVFSPEQINWEIKRIRVSLNYPGRRVTFCDAERGNLLHAFAGTSFSGEPICPFFWLQRKTRLSICP